MPVATLHVIWHPTTTLIPHIWEKEDFFQIQLNIIAVVIAFENVPPPLNLIVWDTTSACVTSSKPIYRAPAFWCEIHAGMTLREISEYYVILLRQTKSHLFFNKPPEITIDSLTSVVVLLVVPFYGRAIKRPGSSFFAGKKKKKFIFRHFGEVPRSLAGSLEDDASDGKPIPFPPLKKSTSIERNSQFPVSPQRCLFLKKQTLAL